MRQLDGGRIAGNAADIHRNLITGQTLHAQIISIGFIHLQHDGLAGAEIDFVLRTVGFESANLIRRNTFAHGIAAGSLAFLDPVNKDCAHLAVLAIGQIHIEVLVIQQNITNLCKDRIIFQTIGILHNITGIIGGAAQGVIDPHAIQIVFIAIVIHGGRSLSGDQLHRISAVGQVHEGNRGNVVVLTGDRQVIHGNALDHLHAAVILVALQHSHDHTGLGIGHGVHIHTGTGEGEFYGCAHGIGEMALTIGICQIIFQRVRPAMDIAIGVALLMLGDLHIFTHITGIDRRPGTGEGEAADSVLGSRTLLGGAEGILIVDVIGRNHGDLVPQIAVFVGILRQDGLAPGITEHKELIITAPVHGNGTIGDLAIFDLDIAVLGIAVIDLSISHRQLIGSVGVLGIKPVHAVFDIAIHMDRIGLLALFIVEVPACQSKLLAVVQHVGSFYEHRCGLLEGKQHFTLAVGILRQPYTGCLVVGIAGATPTHIIGSFHLFNGDLHLEARGMLITDIPVFKIVTGNIHGVGVVTTSIGIGGIGRLQIVHRQIRYIFFGNNTAIFLYIVNGSHFLRVDHICAVVPHDHLGNLLSGILPDNAAIGLVVDTGDLVGSDLCAGNQSQTLTHNIPEDGIFMQNNVLGDLGGDLLHHVGKVTLQSIFVVGGGIVTAVCRCLVLVTHLVIDHVIAHHAVGTNENGLIHRTGSNNHSACGTLIAPVEHICTVAIRLLSCQHIVGVAYFDIVTSMENRTLCHRNILRFDPGIIHALGLGIVGRHRMHEEASVIACGHTGAGIQANGVHICAMGIFGNIGLGDSCIGFFFVEEGVVTGHTVGKHDHNTDTAFLCIQGVRRKDAVAQFNTVLDKGLTAGSQVLGCIDQTGIHTTGAIHAIGNRHQCLLVNALIRVGSCAFLARINTAVTCFGNNTVIVHIAMDLTGLDTISMCPHLLMVSKELGVGV